MGEASPVLMTCSTISVRPGVPLKTSRYSSTKLSKSFCCWMARLVPSSIIGPGSKVVVHSVATNAEGTGECHAFIPLTW